VWQSTHRHIPESLNTRTHRCQKLKRGNRKEDCFMLFTVKAVIDKNLNSVNYLSYFIGLLKIHYPKTLLLNREYESEESHYEFKVEVRVLMKSVNCLRKIGFWDLALSCVGILPRVQRMLQCTQKRPDL
jgi:hypothetical protein